MADLVPGSTENVNEGLVAYLVDVSDANSCVDTHETTERDRTSLQLLGISGEYAWGQFASNYYWHRADNRL